MSLDTLEMLLIEQVQDVYYAEKQLVKALPKMAKAANTASLKAAFTAHLAETEQHVTRLEQVFGALDVSAKTKKCPAIDGLLQEAAEMIEEVGEPSVLDVGLIASAERVEHYEIAAYTAMSQLAEALGHDNVVAMFEKTLTQEQAASEKLSTIALTTVIPAALEASEIDQEDEDRAASAPKPVKAGSSRRSR